MIAAIIGNDLLGQKQLTVAIANSNLICFRNGELLNSGVSIGFNENRVFWR